MDFLTETNWFAIQTKPHCERLAAAGVARLDLEVFLPRVNQEQIICGTRHRVVKPLFRGNGDTDYLCGSCGAVIAAEMGPRQHVIVDTATCSACGAENEFPPELRA